MPEHPDYARLSDLAFWLDGKIGNYPDKWVDLVSGYEFENHGSTFIGNGRRFDGVDDYLNCVLPDGIYGMPAATIEVVIKVNQDVATKWGCVFFAGYSQRPAFGWSNRDRVLGLTTYSTCWGPDARNITTGERVVISCVANGTRALRNGVAINDKYGYTNQFSSNSQIAKAADGITYIGGYPDKSASFVDGDIYCIRIYNDKLTEANIKHNHAIDMARFAINQ